MLRRLCALALTASLAAIALSVPALADGYNRGSAYNPGDRREGRGSDGGAAGVELYRQWNGTDFYNKCKEITNGAIANVFLPSLMETEYDRFLSAPPPGVSLADCGIRLITEGQCPSDCTNAPVTVTQTNQCVNAVGSQLELAICDPTLVAGDASKVIACDFNPFQTTSVCEGDNYVQTTTCRGEVRDVVTSVDDRRCDEPVEFTTSWSFRQEYYTFTCPTPIYDGSGYDIIDSYDPGACTRTIASSMDYVQSDTATTPNAAVRMWYSSANGRQVGAAFQDSDNCREAPNRSQPPFNSYVQAGTATARIRPNRDTELTVSWEGQAETQNGILDGATAATYENMTIRISGGGYNDLMIGKAVSRGGDIAAGTSGSCGSAPIYSVIPASNNTLPTPLREGVEYTLTIETDTRDPLFHVGAFYAFTLNFSGES